MSVPVINEGANDPAPTEPERINQQMITLLADSISATVAELVTMRNEIDAFIRALQDKADRARLVINETSDYHRAAVEMAKSGREIFREARKKVEFKLVGGNNNGGHSSD